jgi:crossover junction endodeoxyribonuclease RuvC
MRILGIDPGTVAMGYGVIEASDDRMTLLDCGALGCPERSPVGERLNFLYGELKKIIAQHKPEAIAIEQPFVAKNVKSALAIGNAQAVAILAAASGGIPSHEYTPAQIQEMVRLQLGLPGVPQPSDAADALAVAICHWHEVRLARLLAEQG